ncbi:MAG: hypothetical protein ABJA78_13425 [Ferruginibacter sp.]
MKILIFVCCIALLASCAKPDIHLTGFSWGYGYGSINRDSTNKITADITGSSTAHFSAVANNTSFTKYVLTLYSDSSFVNISSNDSTIILYIDLVNILSPGTYSFGRNAANSKQIKAKCMMGGIDYFNDSTALTGSIQIDSFTTKRIHASFNVKCWHGTQSVTINNGKLAGDIW